MIFIEALSNWEVSRCFITIVVHVRIEVFCKLSEFDLTYSYDLYKLFASKYCKYRGCRRHSDLVVNERFDRDSWRYYPLKSVAGASDEEREELQRDALKMVAQRKSWKAARIFFQMGKWVSCYCNRKIKWHC